MCSAVYNTRIKLSCFFFLMLNLVFWFDYRPSMFRMLVSCYSRRVLDVLQRTFLTFLIVKLRYLVG